MAFLIFLRDSIHALAICDSLMAVSLSSQPISKFRVVCDPKSIFGRPLSNDVTTVAAIVYAGKIRSGYQTHRSCVCLDRGNIFRSWIASDWRVRQGTGNTMKVVLLRIFGGKPLFSRRELRRTRNGCTTEHGGVGFSRVDIQFDWIARLRQSDCYARNAPGDM